MGGPRVAPLSGLDVPTNCAYLAGLIDGDGTIGIYTAMGARSLSPSFYVQVTVVNTNAAILGWLITRIGARMDKRKDVARRPAHHKQLFHWRVHGTNADLLLTAVRPYLIAKGEQADIALKLRAMRRQGIPLTPDDVAARQALKDEIRRLNARGVPAGGPA